MRRRCLPIVNRKATIVKDTFCDSLGACLGNFSQGAISITEREAPEFNEGEVHKYLKSKESQKAKVELINAPSNPQWPIKLNLVPLKAPFFENIDLLLAADCARLALKDFNDKFLLGKRMVIGCPKFDDAR